VVSTPAARGTRPRQARAVPEASGDHASRPIEFIGHAALAIHRRGGAPTRRHLDHALHVGVDRLEIDLCSSADAALVVRHDLAVAGGRFVGDMTLAELRRDDPQLLTLDEVVEHLGGHMPLLLDLKTARAADLLGRWLSGRRDLADFAICTENVAWLLLLRFAAPRVARWPSFPDIGDRSANHVRRVVAGLWRTHASVHGLRQGVVDIHRAARQLPRSPSASLGHLAGLPWRVRLPLDFAGPCENVAAAGICVQHWQISERLVDEAHRAGVLVNSWTVNSVAVAEGVIAIGVDSVTTDRLDMLRLSVEGPALVAG
jgi:hypothetical protein